MTSMFSSAEMQSAQLVGPFGFTKGMPVMRVDALADARRIPVHDDARFQDLGTRLYDLGADPDQTAPFRDPAIEARLQAGLRAVLDAHECPPEVYERFRLQATSR